MEKMRTILKSLMDKAGHSPYDIQRLTGLPAPTTYRFLNKEINQPRIESIKAWTQAYGITEAQLRGDVPISGIDAPPPEQLELKDLLTLPERKLLSDLKRLDEQKRAMVFGMAEMLALAQPQHEYCADPPSKEHDRRQVDIYPNPQLRISDKIHNSPRQNREVIKHFPNERNNNESKANQTAR
jgi:hypothetical protein